MIEISNKSYSAAMNFNNFHCSLRILGRFSDVELKKIESYVKVISLNKGAFLLREGHICQSIHFVEKGSLRHYHIDESGLDTTLNLFIETDWAFDYQGFLSQEPITSCLQASEDCLLLELNLYDLHKLIKESDSFFQIMRVLKMKVETQITDHLKQSSRDKYLNLISKKPQVIEKFQLKHIASYLGITPETLSRVRQNFPQN